VGSLEGYLYVLVSLFPCSLCVLFICYQILVSKAVCVCVCVCVFTAPSEVEYAMIYGGFGDSTDEEMKKSIKKTKKNRPTLSKHAAN